MANQEETNCFTFGPGGELLLLYPDGREEATGLFASDQDRLSARVFGQTTLARSLFVQLRSREIHDGLTDLLRREPGIQIVQQKIDRIASLAFYGTIAVIMLDLDHFGKVNKKHGHATGDEVLSWFASILRRRTRSSDVIIRWGGEEFVIFTAEGAAPPQRVATASMRERDTIAGASVKTGQTGEYTGLVRNGLIVANRIASSLAATPFNTGGIQIEQSATIAVAEVDVTPDSNLEGLFERLQSEADKLLITAKTKDQRGQVHASTAV